jgi:hypothetical protein
LDKVGIVRSDPGIIDALIDGRAGPRKPEPEVTVIARPGDIAQTGTPSIASPEGETPLQRQILLWQRELVRRAELKAGLRASGDTIELKKAEAQPE